MRMYQVKKNIIIEIGPVQPLLCKLSLVSILLCKANHKNNLNSSGILINELTSIFGPLN
jgi:hypothetical protein